MRAAILRIFILLLLVCVGAFAWESARNAKMQPVTGQVLGTVYKGYIIGYKVQGQSYQLETRIGVVDALTGLGLLTAGSTHLSRSRAALSGADQYRQWPLRHYLGFCVSAADIYASRVAIGYEDKVSS